MSNNPYRSRWTVPGLTCIATCVAIVALPMRGFARGELRDPTRPPDFSLIENLDSATPAPSPYRLSAILVAKGRRVAVINGQPVQAGDRVSNAKVLSILRDKVVLRVGSGDLTIRLLSASIKTSKGSDQ